MIKDILLICSGDVGLPAAVTPALSLARAHGAHLQCLYLYLQPTDQRRQPFRPTGAAGKAQPASSAAVASQSATSFYFHQLAEWFEVSASWREGDVDALAEAAAAHARMFALIISDSPDAADSKPWLDMIETLILESGRACLLVPKSYEGKELGRRIEIAWDDTPASARAVHDAMPLLSRAEWTMARHVCARERDQEWGRRGPLGGWETLQSHLRRHEVTFARGNGSRGPCRIRIWPANSPGHGCDLLVIGAQDRQWVRDELFTSLAGSCGRNEQLPLLVAH